MSAVGTNLTLNFLYKSSHLVIFPKKLRICGLETRSNVLAPIYSMESTKHKTNQAGTSDCEKGKISTSNVGNSSNIAWHRCFVEKKDRQELLNQKGCVIWITGLSGSGKSTVACALSYSLHSRGKLTYILDGDNCRHGLNRDLSFKADDREENIRRIGEVAKLFADSGVICIASLISPFRKDRDACRVLLPKEILLRLQFLPLQLDVYMDVPLEVCESRDPKGLYKLARAGKIKGFTGVDDPYEPPVNSEIVLHQGEEVWDSPKDLADIIVSYLESKGYLQA